MQRSLVLFLCFALVAIFVAGLMAIATPSEALEARVALEGTLERWRTLGGAGDIGAMAPPRVPDAANAAVVYRRAFVELGQLDAADRALLDLHKLRSRPKEVAALAPRLDAVVALAREAGRRSDCEWTRGYYRTGALTPADLAEFDNVVKLAAAVAAHAMDRAASNDYDTAIDDIATMRKMAGHAMTHPHVAQAAMGLFIDIAAFELVERLFRERTLSERAALDLTSPRHYRKSMGQALLTHGTGCILALDDVEAAGIEALEGWQRDRVKTWFLDVMCDYVIALAANRRPAPREVSPPDSLDYAGVFLPAPSLFDAIEIAATRNDMAAAAVKLRSHRGSGGAYPDVWAVPTNPGTGIELGYRRDGSGFVLSAADEDLDWRWE